MPQPSIHNVPEPGDKQGGPGQEGNGQGKGQSSNNGSGMQREPAASSPASETEAAGGAVTGMWQRAGNQLGAQSLIRGRAHP